MRIVSEAGSEDCFDGTLIKDYVLDASVSTGFVECLRNFGEVTFLSSLKKPFYSVDVEYLFTIKGLLGEKRMKVIYRKGALADSLGFLHQLLDSYSKDIPATELDDLKKRHATVLAKVKGR